jgi:hypothetical protein
MYFCDGRGPEGFLINANHIEAKVHEQVRHVLVLLDDYGRENAEDGLRQRGLVKLEPD